MGKKQNINSGCFMVIVVFSLIAGLVALLTGSGFSGAFSSYLIWAVILLFIAGFTKVIR